MSATEGGTATEPGASGVAARAPSRSPLAAIGAFLGGTDASLGAAMALRVFWWAWSTEAIIVLVIDLLNAQTLVHEAQIRNLIEPAWRALVDELSSGAAIVALYPGIYRMALKFPPWDGRIGRFFAAHGLGALVFSALHVFLFLSLRLVIYGLFGELYRFSLGDFAYELPRDVMIYGVGVGGVWGMVVLLQSGRLAPQPARPTFDIRDNARVIRAAIEDILAIQSAGNYVEFLLLDGRRPMMRATLAEMEKQLAPHGLVRTHRSWLVNKRRIDQIDPAGSGDFKLSLAGGVQAPLSRRYRAALDVK